MYGFDASGMLQQISHQSIGNDDTEWASPFQIITNADCGFWYGVYLNIKYGTDGMPPPSSSDSGITIKEEQRLSCKVNLISWIWSRWHPVRCTITENSSGDVVYTETHDVMVTDEAEDIWVDFFINWLIPVGEYTVEWSVCGHPESHDLTVEPLSGYTTNDIDVNVVITSNTGIDPDSVWDVIKNDVATEMLAHDATVKLNWAELKGNHLVVFHLEVKAPIESAVGSIGFVVTVPTLILVALIAAIAVSVVAVPALTGMVEAWFEYNVSMRQFITPDGESLYYEDYCGYMAVNYPDEWDEIKEHIKKPEEKEERDWMEYLMYIIIGVGVLGGLVIFIRYVLPAMRGLRLKE